MSNYSSRPLSPTPSPNLSTSSSSTHCSHLHHSNPYLPISPKQSSSSQFQPPPSSRPSSPPTSPYNHGLPVSPSPHVRNSLRSNSTTSNTDIMPISLSAIGVATSNPSITPAATPALPCCPTCGNRSRHDSALEPADNNGLLISGVEKPLYLPQAQAYAQTQAAYPAPTSTPASEGLKIMKIGQRIKSGIIGRLSGVVTQGSTTPKLGGQEHPHHHHQQQPHLQLQQHQQLHRPPYQSPLVSPQPALSPSYEMQTEKVVVRTADVQLKKVKETEKQRRKREAKRLRQKEKERKAAGKTVEFPGVVHEIAADHWAE